MPIKYPLFILLSINKVINVITRILKNNKYLLYRYITVISKEWLKHIVLSSKKGTKSIPLFKEDYAVTVVTKVIIWITPILPESLSAVTANLFASTRNVRELSSLKVLALYETITSR